MSIDPNHLPIVGSPLTLTWLSETDTAAFAQQLARRPAIGEAFITLHGELGAGKTSFVRYLLRALGVTGRIKSPTYTVAEPHALSAPDPAAAPPTAWHFDFYRFNDPREWEEAGLRDVFAQPCLKLAEWPEKAIGVLPVPDLALHIEVMPDESRQVRAVAHSERGAGLLA